VGEISLDQGDAVITLSAGITVQPDKDLHIELTWS